MITITTTVFIYKCTGYNKDKIKQNITDYFRDTDFAGKRVLLKPNMLQAHAPEENVTTNPVILEAAAEVVIAKGAKCFIGDSPSGKGSENTLKAAKKTGFLDICAKLNIEFDNFDKQRPRGLIVKNAKIFNKVYVPESYFSYDIVINIPKLKTHALTIFTLGVKNMLGLVAGLSKADFHRRAPHPKIFAMALCDLYSVVVPDYTILDGIEGMEGEGPVTGKTRKLNRLFICDNANALDATVEKMCGVSPFKVPLTKEVAQRGIENIENISIEKDYTEDDHEFEGFKTSFIHILGAKIPVWATRALSPFLLHIPKVDKKLCISCKKCMEICPVEAISFYGKYPEFDYKQCIKCFCCGERCTEKAITEERNIVAKIFS